MNEKTNVFQSHQHQLYLRRRYICHRQEDVNLAKVAHIVPKNTKWNERLVLNQNSVGQI